MSSFVGDALETNAMLHKSSFIIIDDTIDDDDDDDDDDSLSISFEVSHRERGK